MTIKNEAAEMAEERGWAFADTGGGCTAFVRTLMEDDREYVQILITAEGEGHAPERAEQPCSIGFNCDSHRFEHLHDHTLRGRDLAEALSIGEALEYTFKKLARVNAPNSVYAYYWEKLMDDPGDESLAELPVESECGKDCVAAIDAAAALLKHVRGAFGLDGYRQRIVLATVRDVVVCFWRG